MSANAPPVPSHRPASRIPGVSISSAPLGQRQQLARHRRVAAAPVARAHGADRLALVAQQRVDERRLARARRTEQDGRRLRLKQRRDRRDRVLVVDAHGERVGDAEPRADRPRQRRQPTASRSAFVSANAAGTPPANASATSRSRAAHLGIGQRLDDEHEVDVRREHLRGERRARGPPRDEAAALEHERDRAVGVERHPVAGRRRVRATRSRPRAGTSRGGPPSKPATSQRARCCASTRPATSKGSPSRASSASRSGRRPRPAGVTCIRGSST